MLNQAVLRNHRDIRKRLRQPLVVIPNALMLEKAEQLYAELMSSAAWIKQTHKTENYSFERDVIPMESESAPAVLKELLASLTSEEMRQWFSDASGRPCDAFKAAATTYGEGE